MDWKVEQKTLEGPWTEIAQFQLELDAKFFVEAKKRFMWNDAVKPARLKEMRSPLNAFDAGAFQYRVVPDVPEPVDDGKRYKVVRYYAHRPNRAVRNMSGLTLAEAQAHCTDPETSSKTCTTPKAKARTRQYGPWFDGYTEEK